MVHKTLNFSPDFEDMVNLGGLDGMNQLLNEEIVQFNAKYDTCGKLRAELDGFRTVRKYEKGCFLQVPIR